MTADARLPGELPLRVVDQPGGAVIRCLCGRELAQIRKGTTSVAGLRAAAALPHLAPDITARGLLIMVVHAKDCQIGRARLGQAG